MPMRGELVCAAGRREEKSQIGTNLGVGRRDDKNPEFQMVTLVCAVGLWLTFAFIARFPDFGAMVDLLEP